jgi:leader peptidase (prepilin peptidase)/N-methyltransferase
MILAPTALFVLGVVVGSFVGVVAHRVPRGETIVTGRSRCDSCGETIAGYDNVPIVSWIVLRGRCRHCGERIPATYPLVELALGVLFALTYLALGDDPAELALGLVLVSVLAAITITDLERTIIPNAILIAGAAICLAIAIPTDPEGLPERLIAALAAGGVLLLVALAYPRGMGMGDVKLAALLGLFLGRAVVPALLVGFAVGALYGLALIARHGAGARKRAVPFGPFLALGGVVGLLAGDEIVDWYLDSFFEG